MTRPGEIRGEVTLAAGEQAVVSVEFRPATACQGPVALRLGITPSVDEDTLMAEAVAAAAAADLAIVMVGSAETSESEGYDRDTLALPGRQDELVQRVAAASPHTVVVVNAGMPVLMPWASQVGAVIYAWLPGQAVGEALADVLLGQAEPGGRLPVTLPAAEADCPVLHALPRDGRLDYAEGLVRVLGAFGGVTASPGETAEVALRVPARVFAVFDEEAGQWSWPPGEYAVQVGRSSRDLRLSLTVRYGYRVRSG
jgi:beta-glucosidase